MRFWWPAKPGVMKQEAIAIRLRWRFRRKVWSPGVRRTRAVRCVAVYTRGGDFMGRVLDVGRLLWQLLPELAARVRSARLPFQGRLTFRTDEGEAAIVITADDVLVDGGANGEGLLVELPQTALARLCLGGFDPADVLARLPNRPDREVEALLRVLFPKRMPHIYPMDRF